MVEQHVLEQQESQDGLFAELVACVCIFVGSADLAVSCPSWCGISRCFVCA